MAAELLVFVGGVLAGTAHALPPERGQHPVLFRYDEAYIREIGRTPLSVSVPVVPGDVELVTGLMVYCPITATCDKNGPTGRASKARRRCPCSGSRIGLDCAGSVQFCRQGAGMSPRSRRAVLV